MISVNDAKRILEQAVDRSASVYMPLSDACGLVLALDITSPVDVPSFDNAAMDGYAFRFDDKQTSYSVIGKVTAGEEWSTPVGVGEAVRIFTGAPVPLGADTVIPQELTREENGSVFFDTSTLVRGASVRLKGSQCKTGDKIAHAGSTITPGLAALLASIGCASTQVLAPPRVGLIITGNELQEPGLPLVYGKIYNSNEAAVKSYLAALSISNITCCKVKDDLAGLKQIVRDYLRHRDVILLTGGISVGEHDFVHQALADEGIACLFYKVGQKPGKPLFAGKAGSTLLVALPGNPASVITCFNQYVKPALLTMMGHTNAFAPSARLPMSHDWEKKGSLTTILKAKKENGFVSVLRWQESFNLLSFAESNCFVLVEENCQQLRKGDFVEVYDW
jgi:molybdopterin molybdotransferase